MPDAAADWLDELPAAWCRQVVPPQHWEVHTDVLAHAVKRVGRDAQGRRCYVQHRHTEVEERFDIDEFPLEVPVRGERRIAWRLLGGRWLLRVDRVERLDSCRPHIHQGLPMEVSETELGM